MSTDFKAIFEGTPTACLILDPDLMILGANDAYLKATLTNRELILGKPLFEVFPDNPENPASNGVRNLRASFYFVLHKKQSHEMPVQQYDIRRPDGTFEERFWLPLNKPILDNEGNIKYIFHQVQDVTEMILLKNVQTETEIILKRLNEQLSDEVREKTKEIRSIVERISDGFIALDINFCYRYANKKFGSIISKDPSGMLGNNFLKILPELKDSSTYEAYIKAMQTQHYIFHQGYYKPLDLWLENHIYPSPEGISVFIRDVTQQKKAEESLKRHQQTIQLIMQNSLDAIICITNTGQISGWNPQAENIFGWKLEEVQEKQMTETLVPERYRSLYARIFHTNNNSHMLNRMTETMGLHKDGTEFPVEMAVIPLKLDSTDFYCAFIKDIHERKEAEEKLKNSYFELKRLTAYLQTIKEEEQRRMAREIHDDLGQQITGLKMDLAMLKKCIQKDKFEPEQYLHKIGEMNELLDNSIKSIRRIATELHPAIIEDLGLVAAIKWQSEEFLKRAGLRIDLDFPKTDMHIPIKIATGLFRIFQESLTNIARHAEASKIAVSLIYENGQLLLLVIDNGKGFHLQESKKKKTLGLLGMRERVSMLNGKLDINSTPGKGTTIKVTVNC